MPTLTPEMMVSVASLPSTTHLNRRCLPALDNSEEVVEKSETVKWGHGLVTNGWEELGED
jgi:hypothetical protein